VAILRIKSLVERQLKELKAKDELFFVRKAGEKLLQACKDLSRLTRSTGNGKLPLQNVLNLSLQFIFYDTMTL